MFRIEFATVRELEKKTFRIFAYGGAAFAVGILFAVVGLLVIGLPLIILSGCALIAAIAWVSILGKEPTNRVFCPYCSSANEVYTSRRSFACDICRRPVNVTEEGEVVIAPEMENPPGGGASPLV